MEKEIKFNSETILLMKKFKEIYWKNWKNCENKEKALEILVMYLAKGTVNVVISENPYSYNPITKTINIDKKNPSVISTLHEFGHHLYGKSELKACRWSVQLFKTIFPKDFKNLKVDGHMFKKI